jgi:predicted nucleic acid-binding protein
MKLLLNFNSRGHHAKAVEVGNRFLTSPSVQFVQFVQVDEKLFKEGWEYFQLHKDKDYSLTDCISFVVMKKLGIETAFAFINTLYKRDSRNCRKKA